MLTFDDWNAAWPLWQRMLASTLTGLLILGVSIAAIASSERMGHVVGGVGLFLGLRSLLNSSSDWASEWPARHETHYVRPAVLGVAAARKPTDTFGKPSA